MGRRHLRPLPPPRGVKGGQGLPPPRLERQHMRQAALREDGRGRRHQGLQVALPRQQAVTRNELRYFLIIVND